MINECFGLHELAEASQQRTALTLILLILDDTIIPFVGRALLNPLFRLKRSNLIEWGVGILDRMGGGGGYLDAFVGFSLGVFAQKQRSCKCAKLAFSVVPFYHKHLFGDNSVALCSILQQNGYSLFWWYLKLGGVRHATSATSMAHC